MSRVSRVEIAVGAPPIVDDPPVVETPKPAPAFKAKAAKPTESEESSA